MNNDDLYPGKHVRVSPEVQRDSGLLFYWGARKYREAATRCSAEFQDFRSAFNRAEDWADLHDPVCNLYCHAIELALKAYLISSDIPETDLARRPYGHDLAKLCDESCKLGLELDQEHIDAIFHLAQSFGKQPYSFRYPQLGKHKMSFPHLLNELTGRVMTNTFPKIIRRARSMGVPVQPGKT